MSVSLTGKDTIIIDSRPITDLADGDCVNLEFSNEKAAVKTGKNNNSIYAYNASGRQADVTLRVIRGSADDKYLNGRNTEYENDPPSFVLMTGNFIKRVGDGTGKVATADTYICSGGIIKKTPSVKENVEGDTEQAVAIYEIFFANCERTL